MALSPTTYFTSGVSQADDNDEVHDTLDDAVVLFHLKKEHLSSAKKRKWKRRK